MEKVVYVATRAANLPDWPIKDVLCSAREAFADPRYRGVSLQLPRPDIEDQRQKARGGVLTHTGNPATQPLAPQLVAMVSLWVDSADDLADATCFVTGIADDVAAYTVTESVTRWWAGPEGIPGGVNAVSLLRRNQDMSHKQFLRHWAEVHMPISLRYHPQWKYVRNPLVRTLIGDPREAPDAIAEEGFATSADLVDPMRFYGAADGDPETLANNRAIVFEDVPLFLDVSATTTFVTEEHIIRAAWSPRADDRDQSARRPAMHGRN